MCEAGWVDRLWFGEDGLAATARTALLPLAGAYGAVMGAREMLFDLGILRVYAPALPTISIGNLSVGGTGKTPVAAWIARGLAERGARPAVVLRGYGADEPLVHQTLNPGIRVIVAADRVRGITRARAEGATVAVLDDAFQHRRVRRDADLLLVSADRWAGAPHLLPAGPWREPLRASRRATLIVVTRKAVPPTAADAVNETLARVAPQVPRTTLHLAPAELVEVGSGRRTAVSVVAGRDVRLLTAIGDPGALTQQLEQLGARVRADVYPDHHHFSDDEVARFAGSLPSDGLAVCTLKDAVKLVPRWPPPPAAPPLWYVSQHITVERGIGGVERILDDLVRARDVQEP